MSLYPQFKLLAVVSLLVGGILALIWFSPLGRETKWLYRFNEQPQAEVVLTVGQSIRQTLTPPAGTITAINFYANAPRLTGNTRVRLLDTSGNERALAYGYIPSYSEGHLVVTAFIPWTTTKENEQLDVEITRLSGDPLPLLTLNNSLYKSQKLFLQKELIPDRIVPLQLVRPTPTVFATKQGALVASFFLIALATIYTFTTTQPRLRAILIGVLCIVFTPLALAGFWFSADKLGINDWDYYFSLHHIWQQTVLTYHQFPFWNPYICGGTAALGDPEFSVLTPTFMWELLLGIPAGLRLAIFTSVAIGAIGMLQLARRVGMSWLAAVLVMLIGVYGSVNTLEIVEGHVNIFAAMWVPWIFWSWLGAYRQTRIISQSTILLAIFLSLTFYQGGIYLLLYTLLAFLVLPVLVQHPGQAIKVTAAGGIWALGLAGLKLLPVLLWLREFPDQAYAQAPYTWRSTAAIFFERYVHGATIVPNQIAGWHEYGAYIGVFAFSLSLVGLTLWRRRVLARGLVIAAVLAWGLSTIGPFLVPFFDKMPFLPRSMITRVVLYTVIPLALLAGLGFDVVQKRWPQGRVVALIMLCLVSFDLVTLGYRLSEQAFIVPQEPASLPPAQKPLQFTRRVFYTPITNGEKHITQYPVTLAGYGTLNYCSVIGPTGHIRAIEDEVSQRYAQTRPADIPVTIKQWSPNQVTVEITTTKETKVIINTNYADGWLVNGQPAEEFENRVGTSVPAGEHTIVYSYHPPGFPLGSLITVVTLLLTIYISIQLKLPRAVLLPWVKI